MEISAIVVEEEEVEQEEVAEVVDSVTLVVPEITLTTLEIVLVPHEAACSLSGALYILPTIRTFKVIVINAMKQDTAHENVQEAMLM